MVSLLDFINSKAQICLCVNIIDYFRQCENFFPLSSIHNQLGCLRRGECKRKRVEPFRNGDGIWTFIR